MKVSIFGASGLVGRSLRDYFDEKKIDYIGTYNQSPYEGGFHLENTEEEYLVQFLKNHQITSCVNCVAQRNVDTCEKNWEDAYEINCAFAKRLALACKELNIFFVHLSTDYVFDGSNSPYSPTSPHNPIQAYGKSKDEAEKEVLAAYPDSCIVRVPVLYTQRYKTILETAVTMIGKKVMDRTRNYEEDNYCIRRPVFIDDLCVFVSDLVEKQKSGVYHFFNRKDAVTKYQMAKAIGNYLRVDTSHIKPVSASTNQAGRPYDTQLMDSQYNRDEYPETSIQEGILECFEKFKHKPFEWSPRLPADPTFFMIDLDGTLVDTDRIHYYSYKIAFEHHGFPFCSWEEYNTIISLETYCKEKLGLSYEEVKETKNKVFYSAESIGFLPGAERFLLWLLLRQQNFVIVTNTSRQTVAFLQSKIPLLQYVQQWVTREDVSNPKPDSEPYRLAKEKFWRGEPRILGFENTEAGYRSISPVASIVYILCESNSHTYKQLYKNDAYFISSFDLFDNTDYYFFGELGYFHEVILAYTQRFVQQFPEKKGKICIHTFEGNDVILERLFPRFFKYTTVKLVADRGGFHSSFDKKYNYGHHISNMFHEALPNWLGDINYRSQEIQKYYIQTPIPLDNSPTLDAIIKPFSKCIVVFFRKRDMEPHRNFSDYEDIWITEVKKQFQDTSTLCCIYRASAEECQVPSFVDINAKNVFLISNVEEAIYFFNKCDITYMNDSGLADFAKNCGVKKILFRVNNNATQENHGTIFIGNFFYNPFQTDIQVAGEFSFS